MCGNIYAKKIERWWIVTSLTPKKLGKEMVKKGYMIVDIQLEKESAKTRYFLVDLIKLGG